MNVVCHVSGGADSALAAVKAKIAYVPGGKIYPLFCDYNQVCMEQELACAEGLVQKLGLEELKVVTMRDLWTSGGMIDGEHEEDPDVYTPLRNLMFVAAAMAYADTVHADTVVVGSKGFSKVEKDDYSFYDSTLSFYSLMEAVWNYTTEDKRMVKILPILAVGRRRAMTKKEAYDELLHHGIGKDDTWSCFKGGNTECGECHNCVMKKKIFQELAEEEEQRKRDLGR